jgi:hypothetical protein
MPEHRDLPLTCTFGKGNMIHLSTHQAETFTNAVALFIGDKRIRAVHVTTPGTDA